MVRSDSSEHFSALDGLRGVAALTVVVGHATATTMQHRYVAHMEWAVPFFFTLSGFVLACAYDRRMRAGLPRWRYFIQRIIRLYPLIILGALLGTVAFNVTVPNFWTGWREPVSILCGALGIPSVYVHYNFSRFPINPPAWSLFYEILASILFGLVMPWISTRRLILLAATLFGIMCSALITKPGSTLAMIPGICGLLFEFTAGVILWRLHEGGYRLQARIPFSALGAIVVATCFWPYALGGVAELVVAALVFPLLILCGAALGSRPPTRVQRFLRDISYPVYILHWPVIVLMTDSKIKAYLGPEWTVIAECIGAVAIAWIALVWFDEPVRRFLSRVMRNLLSRPKLARLGADATG